MVFLTVHDLRFGMQSVWIDRMFVKFLALFFIKAKRFFGENEPMIMSYYKAIFLF